MGTETLTEVADGDEIRLATGNTTVQALKGDVVPRNTEGVAANQGGGLGTAQYPFRELHVRDLIVNGTPLEIDEEVEVATQLFANGVVRGMAPTGRPGMCGWMNEAQADGIVLHASETEPLVVRVGGREYSLTADVTGGTPLPAIQPSREYDITSYSPTITSTTDFPSDADRGVPFEGTNGRFMGFTGRPVRLDQSTSVMLPSAFGNNIIIRLSDEPEYIPCERGPNINNGQTIQRMLRNSMNSRANTGYNIDDGGYVTANISHSTLGYVFVDPTTDPWSIMQETLVLGAIADTFPAGAEGQILFRDSNSKWYRFESGNWIEKEWVLLGISATHGSPARTQAVLGVRSEDSLAKLRPLARVLHSPGVWDRSRSAYYVPTRSGNIITWASPGGAAESSVIDERGPQNYISQSHEPVAARYQIDTAERMDQDLRTISSNEGTFNVWVSAETGQAFSDLVSPNPTEIGPGEVVLLHPAQNAVWIGSYAVDNNSAVSNRITLPNQAIAVSYNLQRVRCPAIWYTGVRIDETDGGGRDQVQATSGGRFVGIRDSRTRRDVFRDNWFLGPVFAFELVGSGSSSRNKVIRLDLPTMGDIADAYYNVVD